MGRAYDKEYLFAGTFNVRGDMQCVECGKKIDSITDDWMAAKKTKNNDWYYISRHRQCTKDQSGWEGIEREQAQREKQIEEAVADLSKYKDATGRMSSVFYEALESLGVECA